MWLLIGILLATALTAALPGCSSVLTSNEPPQRIYWLESTSTEPSPGVAAVQVALVPGLNSDHIWILQPDMRLNYYAGALWADRLDLVLRSVIERSLDAGAGSNGGIELEVLIERFFAVEGNPGEIPRVELTALIRRSDWQGPACAFTSSTNPATDRLRDIVAAHQWVLDQLIGALRTMALGTSNRACPG